jgi:hypothetical protein
MSYYDYDESLDAGGGYLREYIMVYDYTWQRGTREAMVWAVRAKTADDAARAVLEQDDLVDRELMGYEERSLVDGREFDLTHDIMAVVSFDGSSAAVMFTDTDPEDLASAAYLETMYSGCGEDFSELDIDLDIDVESL